MVDDHTDLDEANRQRAKEEERYRDEVSKGRHGAHKPMREVSHRGSKGAGRS